jgi:hypothetical protein
MMRRSCHVLGVCLAIAVMAAACGSDDDDDSAGPSGGAAGSTGASSGSGGSGGIAGSQPEGSGGASSGGTAGSETGGTAGSGGTGGTLVLDPPGPGIACGDATCDEGSEVCCADESSRSCTTSGCSGNVIRLECDDSADCPGEGCCFSNIFSSVRIATFCTSDCASIGYTQVCKEPGDCDNGEVCHAFSCGGFDTGSVTLGLCAATAPGACE